jgi:serine/threonine protein kinase, bacterial
MGVVWRGHDRMTGAVYAIKVLRSEYADDPGAVGRFVRERTALVAFRHPNVVTVHDMIVEGDQLALVMDLVPGGDLAGLRKARGGRLAPPEAASLAAQIADGLAAAHAAGIVHRDLKPANALFNNGRVLLADFGIALLADQPQVTTAGQVLGTATYLPPEVIGGREPGPAGDVYALGITLYELLAGQPPFTGNTAAILHAQVAAVPARAPGIPDALWEIIDRCLAKDPASRPPTTEVAAALHAFAGHPATQAAQSGPATQAAPVPVPVPVPVPQSPEWPPGPRMWPDPLQAVRPMSGSGERPPLAAAPRSTAPKERGYDSRVVIAALSVAAVVVLAVALVAFHPFRSSSSADQRVHLASASQPASESASAAATRSGRATPSARPRKSKSAGTTPQQDSTRSPAGTQPSPKPPSRSRSKPTPAPSKSSSAPSPSASSSPATVTDAGGLPILQAGSGQQAHDCTILGSAYDGDTGVRTTVEGIVCADILTSASSGSYVAQGQLEVYCQTVAGADVQCADAIAEGELATASGGVLASTGAYQCGHSYGPCATGRNYVKTSAHTYPGLMMSDCSSSTSSPTDVSGLALGGGTTRIELPGSGDWVSLGGNQSTGSYYICP